ncbi:retrovirus-related pol polyprotein from transposon TNT 1-94 [Tanacetum coccineum]|uniref:Retrovirus-related pol polyprotein from transposon TNT 1-94 n=1 Tax=Tanacetum coccineum TaxID=301880 RepID=A0ABQ4X7R4_9ASTR
MTSLADKSLLSGGDNKPPMLEKHLYDSWKSRMELYMMNRPHGRMILASVEKGPLVWPSITEDGVTRLKEYVELTPAEAIQADCDIKAINIILQGLPTEIYALVSQHRVAKDLWEKIKLLMQGTSLTKQERECKLFTLLLNDMNIYKMPLEQFQVNTKFLNTLPDEWSKFVTDVKLVKDLHTTNVDQLHAHLQQHERHAIEVRMMHERNPDPTSMIALNANRSMNAQKWPLTECFPDSDETLALSEESRSKMLLKEQDPLFVKHKVNTKPINYAILQNDYYKRFVRQTDLYSEHAYIESDFGPKTRPLDPSHSSTTVIVEVPKELPTEQGLVIAALKNELRKLKGKALDNEDTVTHSVVPKANKDDMEPIIPKLLNKSTAHNPRNIKHYPEKLWSLGKYIVEQVKSKLPQDPLYLQVNTKNDRILQTPSSNSKNKVEAHPRNVKSSLNKRNGCSKSSSGILDSCCSREHYRKIRISAHQFPLVNSLGTELKSEIDQVAKIMGFGDYQIGNVTISRVYYVEGLGHNLFSVGQFCDSNLEVAFRQHTCFIRNLEGVDLLTGSRGDNLYTLSLGNMMASSPICLLSKASKTKSWLWHRRLSHLNFGSINHLARHGLVRGLPKLKFEKDHLCSACALGKSSKKPHKPKSEDTNQEKLYLLHMDLCGPMRVASVNGKKYILVIVDDYSRFTWVKCLRSKDEAPAFIINFLKMIQVRLKETVRRIRTDNGTEFVNQTLREYYEKVGISHETSVARSPQQNGVVERRNQYLADTNLHVHLEEIKVDKTLRFDEEPVEIIDREVKSLKRSRISIVKSIGTRSESCYAAICTLVWASEVVSSGFPIVKLRRDSKRGPKFIWEREDM